MGALDRSGIPSRSGLTPRTRRTSFFQSLPGCGLGIDTIAYRSVAMKDSFVPESFEPPSFFEGPGFRLEPLGPEHNERDHEAWSSSMGHIRSTPGDWRQWPHPMTPEENLRDLEMHAREFHDREAFTYSILDGDEVIGCLYIYPDEEGDSDAYVSSWVRESQAGMDAVVWRAVSDWLGREWPFARFRYAERRD